MRAKGKFREVIDIATGNPVPSFYPVSLDEAIKEDVAKYWPMTPCPIHGGRPVFFTLTQQPGCCVHPAAVDAYNEAVVSKGEPSTILRAKQMGLDYYWSPMAHQLCGHPGKTLFNGKCAFCKELKDNSPRQAAIREGKAWYMPHSTDPCPKGHVSLRRVNNGSCKQCEEERRGVDAEVRGPREEQPINKVCPNLVISRVDAKALGYKVYRTGEACRAGHKGWRYVSTGGCLDCKNG